MWVLLPFGLRVLALFERLGNRMDVINFRCSADVQSGVLARLTAGTHGAEKLVETTGSGPRFYARGIDRITRVGALASVIVDWRRMRFDVVGGDRLFSARDP
ncbi:hypothetical protein [Arthrobacter sp. SLBN-53]|uniref:hypothetical protein n=1 Tax=Arthrobacter sp. SLBN-53 TaxID=2768412 RepID=UPI00115436D9|nr:hypothetical protein [Arthrobacter sp. SLBN-53]TQK29955.1 hypothetical protein FBY28_2966 [Arthrobacter sp. SLBN-53]